MATKSQKAKPSSVEPPEAPPLRLEWLDADQLEANPSNWRTHPETQASALRDVLAEVGWAGALLYNERTGRLVDGHLRKKVAAGQRVPVLIGDWTEEQEKKILVTLDPIAAMAEADKGRLDALLRDVQTGSEALAGMLTDLAEQNGIVPGLNGHAMPDDAGPQIDRAAELHEKWGTRSGQLWLIPSKSVPGKEHSLLCGDSTKAEDVARVMGGEKAGLCFTSPPYAQQRDYGQKITDWDALMQGVFGNLPMADDGQVLVNLGLVHRDGEWLPYWDGWIEWMRQQGWRRFGWYVWDKLSGMPGDWGGRLAPSHEFVFHFNRAAAYPTKSVECKNAGRVVRGRTRGADGEYRTHTATKNGEAVQSHKIADSVIRMGTVKGQDTLHPAVFPVAFPAFAMQCWPGLCYEPFAGSGTTIVAGEQTGRLVRGIELEPKYIAVCLERLAALDLEPRLADG